jgi:uncharacterized repeat protein (TIGR03803 family)
VREFQQHPTVVAREGDRLLPFGNGLGKHALKLTTLYSFCSQTACADGEQGGNAAPALIQATDGNFYGTTPSGGANGGFNVGYGTIFKISLSGELTTLYTFCIEGGCKDGGQPYGGLIQDTSATFYGTTEIGGATLADGSVFSLSVGLGPFVKTLPASGKVGAARHDSRHGSNRYDARDL